MTTIKTKAEWVFGERPKEDGEYLCMLGWNESQLDARGVAFTVKYGWNTSRGKDGIVMYPETALKNYALAWAEIVPPRLEIDGEAIECSSTQ